MLRRLLSVGGFTLLSRIAGFIQNIVMAAILGDGLLSDAYFVALRLPNSFRGIFAEGAFNVAFIPRYAALRTREGDDAAFRFADRVFSWQMAAQLALLLAALVFMPQIVAIMAPGFSQHAGQVALAVDFSRITFPYLILTVVAVQLSAMLNAHEKFAAAAAWSIFLNLAVIGTLLLSGRFTNAGYAASWGVLLARFRERADRTLRRHDHRQFSSCRRADRHQLCRPRQSTAAWHARHRAGNGAAAGDVAARG